MFQPRMTYPPPVVSTSTQSQEKHMALHMCEENRCASFLQARASRVALSKLPKDKWSTQSVSLALVLVVSVFSLSRHFLTPPAGRVGKWHGSRCRFPPDPASLGICLDTYPLPRCVMQQFVTQRHEAPHQNIRTSSSFIM